MSLTEYRWPLRTLYVLLAWHYHLWKNVKWGFYDQTSEIQHRNHCITYYCITLILCNFHSQANRWSTFLRLTIVKYSCDKLQQCSLSVSKFHEITAWWIAQGTVGFYLAMDTFRWLHNPSWQHFCLAIRCFMVSLYFSVFCKIIRQRGTSNFQAVANQKYW